MYDRNTRVAPKWKFQKGHCLAVSLNLTALVGLQVLARRAGRHLNRRVHGAGVGKRLLCLMCIRA